MIFFSDFDGTLTLENRALTPEFFQILDHLKKNHHELVIVSGRSLSWGHFFLTHFPDINYCLMEGGGVLLKRDHRGEILELPLVEKSEIDRLATFTSELKKQFPKIPLSVDSFGRLTDRAIEFNLMSEAEMNPVMEFMQKNKVNYSKSNVHINFWCGEISKFLGVDYFLKHEKPNLKKEESYFFGDAPNDESMFQFFENSVGVSNIKHCLHRLKHLPRIILEGEENAGPKGVLNFIKKF